MSLYPTEEEITMFGEKIKYPGLKDGKFTNGSFSDPKQLASFIPAETLNLILDNLGEAIKSVGLEPNNTNINQLAQALNLRTNYKVSQELMEDLIVLDTNNEFKHLEINESGYIYSQDIDLKQKLADKLKRNKDDIKIINWYIIKRQKIMGICFFQTNLKTPKFFLKILFFIIIMIIALLQIHTKRLFFYRLQTNLLQLYLKEAI